MVLLYSANYQKSMYFLIFCRIRYIIQKCSPPFRRTAQSGEYMKLNPDCIRHVMLAIEDIALFNEDGSLHCADLEQIRRHKDVGCNYSASDIRYSIIQLHEANYIVSDMTIDRIKRRIIFEYIMYITPKGHELIAPMQDENSWKEKIRPALSGFKSISFEIIETVSKGVASALIERSIPTLF